MTDDLVNHLRRCPYDFTQEAADRIEALEAALQSSLETCGKMTDRIEAQDNRIKALEAALIRIRRNTYVDAPH